MKPFITVGTKHGTYLHYIDPSREGRSACGLLLKECFPSEEGYMCYNCEKALLARWAEPSDPGYHFIRSSTDGNHNLYCDEAVVKWHIEGAEAFHSCCRASVRVSKCRPSHRLETFPDELYKQLCRKCLRTLREDGKTLVQENGRWRVSV